MKPRNAIVVRSLRELENALHLPPSVGAEIEVRSALCDKLISAVEREKLTHTQIARRAGASRTRVTAILNRNLHGVSTDLLLRILGALGYKARISLTKVKSAA
jgi:predicted XRE-type DNA-binding protein